MGRVTIGPVTPLRVVREHPGMIRDVVIHATSEQPLMADLFDLPSAEDAGLLCTNLRMMDGKRPVFIDHIESTFFFPYHVVRFIEIPMGAVPAQATSRRKGPAVADERSAVVADPGAASLLPVAVGAPDGAADDEGLDIDIDEGFLQRVRDI
jgi:hypothetical protein